MILSKWSFLVVTGFPLTSCSIAQRTVRNKLKVVALLETGKVFLRQVASGHTHGDAVAEVVGEFQNASLAYSDPP